MDSLQVGLLYMDSIFSHEHFSFLLREVCPDMMDVLFMTRRENCVILFVHIFCLGEPQSCKGQCSWCPFRQNVVRCPCCHSTVTPCGNHLLPPVAIFGGHSLSLFSVDFAVLFASLSLSLSNLEATQWFLPSH